MKRYLVQLGPRMWGVSLAEREYTELDLAIEAIEQSAKNSFVQSGGGVHPAGWPIVTLHGTASPQYMVTGGFNVKFDPSLVATIYEIEVGEGQTAQGVWDTWHDKQKQIAQEARQNALREMRRRALSNLPLVWEGRLIQRLHEDREGYEQDRLYVDEDWGSLEHEIIMLLGGASLDLLSESIDLGRVRITIERVESDQE